MTWFCTAKIIENHNTKDHKVIVWKERNMPRDEPGGLGELCSLSGWLKLIEVVLTFMTLLIHR